LTRSAICLLLALGLVTSFGIAGGAPLHLVYTGGTRSSLEPTAANGVTAGGLARRATIIRVLVRTHPNALVLDAGGLFSGDAAPDRARCALHLRAMRDLGYRAVGAGPDELRFGPAFPDSVSGPDGPALLSCNLWDSRSDDLAFEPFRIFDVDGLRVGVLGLSGRIPGAAAHYVLKDPEIAAIGAVAGLEARTDLILLLSGLDGDLNQLLAERIPAINVILARHSQETIRWVGSTAILGAATAGDWVGRATVSVGPSGVNVVARGRIQATDEIAPDGAVSDTLEAFYDRHALPGDGMQAAAPGNENRFVGAGTCATCHSDVYTNWLSTAHARAFETLLAGQAHFHPDCLPCHTTGYGHTGGFGPGNRETDLAGVGCESCHGPGRSHVRRPGAGNIGPGSGVDVCLRCHTTQQSPDFRAGDEHALKLSAHGRIAGKGRETPVEPVEAGPVRVELFVMPECPYGIQAESVLIPIIKRMGDAVDFQLRYVAEPVSGSGRRAAARRYVAGAAPACEGEPIPGSGRFQSLHGDEEVAEGIRQVVMALHEPERYLAYVLCRGRSDMARSWEDCAAEVGINPIRISTIAESPEGEALYAENILRSNLLGIRASPTLLIDGIESASFHDAIAFQRALCGERIASPDCASLPACTADRDCRRPGMVGLCVDPGQPGARCVYQDPVQFQMVVVNDPDCRVCDTGFFIKSTLDLFPGVQIRNVDAGTDEGASLIARYGLEALPAFILDEHFVQAARYPRFERTVSHRADAYLPRPEMVPVRQLLNRPVDNGRIDLFLDPGSSSSMKLAGSLVSWAISNGLGDSLRVYYLPTPSDSREARWHVCVRDLDPSGFAGFLSCRVHGTVGGRRDLTVEACLAALGLVPERVARCVAGTRADSLLQSDVARAGILGLGTRPGSLVVLDGRIVVSARMAARVPELYRRLHPAPVSGSGPAGE